MVTPVLMFMVPVFTMLFAAMLPSSNKRAPALVIVVPTVKAPPVFDSLLPVAIVTEVATSSVPALTINSAPEPLIFTLSARLPVLL